MTRVFDTLIHAAAQWPEKEAVIDEYGSLSYSALLSQASELSRSLKAKGLHTGLGLSIITRNSRHFILALYAGTDAGALVMPVSHQLQQKEIRDALREGQMHYILSDAQEFAALGTGIVSIKVGEHILFLSRTERPIQDDVAAFVPDAAFMRFTSGTTGAAKGVIISHRSVLERVDAANEVLQLGAEDRVVWVLPMAYHFVVSLVLYIKYGAAIIINDLFLADSLTESINTHRGTFLYAAPMHIKLLAGYAKDVSFPTLTKVISTTTGINPEVCRQFEDKYHIPVSQAYGIIEIGLPIINLVRSKEYPEAVGYALPAYQVAILDSNLEALSDDSIGLLGIRGPGMFDAYLSPPTPREEVLQNGWFMTGDYAVRKPDGLIIIQGREKNMINVSGNKVFPNEVEDVVNTYPGILNSRAYGRVHPLMGEVVALDIVVAEEASIDKEALIRFCRKSLSGFKLPQYINIVDSIDMTGSGKVKRT